MAKLKKLAAMAGLCIREPETLLKGVKYLKNHGAAGFMENLRGRAEYETNPDVFSYLVGLEKKGPFNGEIKFSVIMPVYNVEVKWLEKAIQSVQNQNYVNWELCIADDCSTKEETREYLKKIDDPKIHIKMLEKNCGISEATNAAAEMADGDYLVLMDNDDELSFFALFGFYKNIMNTKADIIYSDQDIIDENGNHREPLFKPDWSPDLMRSQMYVGHLLGFRRSLFKAVGGFRSKFNGSQDYDLFLRMSEKTDNIQHVSKICYSWRALPSSTAANPDSKPYAQTAGLMAVSEHLERIFGKGNAEAFETEDLFVYDVRYKLEEKPLVSIIMPTKDAVNYLREVIDSIEEKTEYPNYEVLILDNNSEKEETFRYFEEVTEKYSNVRVVKAELPFNWSLLNNFGMKQAKGDVFIFMNNDMKVISPQWMTRLTEKALRPDCGVVGGLLLYEDGTIQHAGVVCGIGGWADHVFKGMKPVHYGSPFLSPMVTRNVTAVTGACMAISRKTIEEIGTFNENFIVCGSDVEICIRALQCGKVNIYDPYVRLYHYESKSRDPKDIPEVDFTLSHEMYMAYNCLKDPYYNENLDYMSSVPKVSVKKQDAGRRRK